MSAVKTDYSNDVGIENPEVPALLENATKILQDLLAEKSRFLAMLSRVIGENYACQHQVFGTVEGYVYGLITCSDDLDNYDMPLLVTMSMAEEFLIEPRPEHVTMTLHRRYLITLPNDIVSGAPAVYHVRKVYATNSRQCLEALSGFRERAKIVEVLHKRLGTEIISCLL